MLKVKQYEVSIEKLFVLTWDEKREVEKDGLTIQFKPLWEWLLEEYKQVDIPIANIN